MGLKCFLGFKHNRASMFLIELFVSLKFFSVNQQIFNWNSCAWWHAHKWRLSTTIAQSKCAQNDWKHVRSYIVHARVRPENANSSVNLLSLNSHVRVHLSARGVPLSVCTVRRLLRLWPEGDGSFEVSVALKASMSGSGFCRGRNANWYAN